MQPDAIDSWNISRSAYARSLDPARRGLLAARRKLNFALLSINEQNVHGLRVEHLERESRLRRNDDELLNLIGGGDCALERQCSCSKTVRIEDVIFHGHVTPNLVHEVRRLIAPADVNSCWRGFHNLHA